MKIAGQHVRCRRQLAIFAFDAIGISINEDGLAERHELEAIGSWLSTLDLAGTSAIDVGANIGNHSVFLADYFQKVHSFEPNPRTFRLLEVNADLSPKIKCYNFGLSDRNGRVNFAVDPNNIGASRIVDGPSNQTIEVRCLDDVLEGSERIGLIKIDAEGHEYEVIIGAGKLLEEYRPVVMFEQLPQEIENGSSRTISALRDRGYRRFAVMRRRRGFFKAVTDFCLTETFKPDYYPLIIALP